MEGRKIGGLGINKRHKRNEWIYNEYVRLRGKRIGQGDCLVMLFEHEYNTDDVRGWKLSVDTIESIVKHCEKRKPVV